MCFNILKVYFDCKYVHCQLFFIDVFYFILKYEKSSFRTCKRFINTKLWALYYSFTKKLT